MLLEFTVAVLKDGVETENLKPYAARYFAELNGESAPRSSADRQVNPSINVVPTNEDSQSVNKSTVAFADLPDGVAGRDRDLEVEMSVSDLTKLNMTPSAVEVNKQTDEELEGADKVSELPKNQLRPARKGRRISVSAESFDPTKDPSELEAKLPTYTKTSEELERLQVAMSNALILRTLEPDQLEKVALALVPKNFQPGEEVIREGDEDANHFYIIENGIFDCFKKDHTGENQKIYEYNGAGAFGELALLYNQPRAATITARTDAKLWALDRGTFQVIVVRAAYKKRELYMNIMNKIDFLSELTEYEKQNVCDALMSKYYNDGDVIINQGDEADGLYFMEEGVCRAFRREKAEDPETEIAYYEQGGYFGELALITNKPRAATIRADGKVRCAFLDISAFERLCGPGREVMKRNIEKYEAQLNALGLNADLQ